MVHVNRRTVLIGEQVASFRSIRGLSQAKLAQLADVSQATISRIEAGEGRVNADIMLKLAAGLGVSIESLIGVAMLEDKVVTAARPADNSSSMEKMRKTALHYFADYRRVVKP